MKRLRQSHAPPDRCCMLDYDHCVDWDRYLEVPKGISFLHVTRFPFLFSFVAGDVGNGPASMKPLESCSKGPKASENY